jgi:hypothetical protein
LGRTAVAGRLANQQGRAIWLLEVIPWGQVLAARQVGGGKQTKEVNGTARMSLTMRLRRGGWHSELEPLKPPVYNLAER